MDNELYFKKLVDIVDPDSNNVETSITYNKLFKCMDNIAFDFNYAVLIPNDSNRIIDALYFREKICSGEFFEKDFVSLFEMLISFAEKISQTYDDDCSRWFWIMLENLGIDGYSDDIWNDEVEQVCLKILDKFVKRKYSYKGEGSIFPLENPPQNMKDVELWCQMSWYITKFYDYYFK